MNLLLEFYAEQILAYDNVHKQRDKKTKFCLKAAIILVVNDLLATSPL